MSDLKNEDPNCSIVISPDRKRKKGILTKSSINGRKFSEAKLGDIPRILIELIDKNIGFRVVLANKLNTASRTRDPIKLCAEAISSITYFSVHNVLIALKDKDLHARIMELKLTYLEELGRALFDPESKEYNIYARFLGRETTNSMEVVDEEGKKQRTTIKDRARPELIDNIFNSKMMSVGNEFVDSVQIPINFNETVEAMNDEEFEILSAKMKLKIQKNLTRSQREVLHRYDMSNKRSHILDGCVRAGKSYIATYLALLDIEDHINKKKSGQIVFIGASANSLYANVFKGIINELFKLEIPAAQALLWKLGNLNIRIIGSNKESIKGLRGITATRIFIDEAQNVLCNEDIMSTVETRMAKPDVKVIMTCNTGSPSHPLYAKYLKDPSRYDKLSVERYHFNLNDEVAQGNPHINPEFPDYIGELFGFDSAQYKKEILGEWVGADEAIYKFSEERDVFDQSKTNLDKYDDIYIGVDQGTNSPKVFIMIGIYIDYETGKKKVDVIDELYYQKGHMKRNVIQKYEEDLDMFIAPIKHKLRAIYTPHDAGEYLRYLNDIWKLPAVPASTEFKVVEGIGVIQFLLATQYLKISSKCKNLIREMMMYQFETKDGIDLEKIRKSDDHAPDALRYAITSCGVYGSKTYELYNSLINR